MRKGRNRWIDRPSRYRLLWLLAAVIGLCPAAASAGSHDTATGTGALVNESGGHDNTADGYDALYSNTTGIYNTGIGAFALTLNTTGKYNTATGYVALYSNTDGGFNTADGHDALYGNTTGGFNTASGSFALKANTTGGYNTANGSNALTANTTGGFNTATGAAALYANTTGYYNVALGYEALDANQEGSSNVAAGTAALYANTTGNYNVALGYEALDANVHGGNNVAVGANALLALNGNGNIALGFNAGRNTTSGNSNIYIGHPGIKGAESKVIRIGIGQTKAFMAGIAGTPLSGATVVVRSNGQLGVVASSARYKQDIHSLDDASDRLARLRPVSFRYKSEPQATHYGLIAEEVDKVMPELVVRDEQNRPESVQYLEIIPLLLHQWKAQQAEIARQHALIERQEAELAELRRALATRLAAREAGDKGSELRVK